MYNELSSSENPLIINPFLLTYCCCLKHIPHRHTVYNIAEIRGFASNCLPTAHLLYSTLYLSGVCPCGWCFSCLNLNRACHVLPNMMMASRYPKHVSHWRPACAVSMRWAKVAGALHRLKGKSFNLYSCPTMVEKAVLAKIKPYQVSQPSRVALMTNGW